MKQLWRIWVNESHKSMKPCAYFMGHNVFAYAMATFHFLILYQPNAKNHFDVNLTITGSKGDCHNNPLNCHHWQVGVVIMMTLTCQWMCLYMPLHNFLMPYYITVFLISCPVSSIFNIPCGLSFSGGDHLGCTTPELANIGPDWLGIISWVNRQKKSKSGCGQYYYDW